MHQIIDVHLTGHAAASLATLAWVQSIWATLALLKIHSACLMHHHHADGTHAHHFVQIGAGRWAGWRPLFHSYTCRSCSGADASPSESAAGLAAAGGLQQSWLQQLQPMGSQQQRRPLLSRSPAAAVTVPPLLTKVSDVRLASLCGHMRRSGVPW